MATQAFAASRQMAMRQVAMRRPDLARPSQRRPYGVGPYDRVLRVPDLPVLPGIDESPTARRPAGWERRFQKAQQLERAKTALALAIGGVLGTTVGTVLCVTLLG